MGNLFRYVLGGGIVFAIVKAMGGSGQAGGVVHTGTAVGATDGIDYEWRVINSEEGAEFPFAAQSRQKGVDTWTVEHIVAFGPTAKDAKANLMAWLCDNT